MEVKKMFYTMGEVAEMFDVSSSLIRYWEKQFSVIKPTRNKKGNRLFTPKDIENFKLIYHLVKERGMTLEGAKKSIGSGKLPVSRESDLMDRLLNIRSLLLEVRQELKVDEEEEEPQIVESLPILDVEEVEPNEVEAEVAPVPTPTPTATPTAPRETKRSEEKELFAFYEQNLF